MDENNDDLSLQNNQGQQGGSGGQMAQKGADAARRAADAARNAKKAADAAKAAKAAGTASKMAALAGTPVGWIVLAVLAIIVFLIIFIGVYAYTVGVWGSIVEKLKDWGTSAWTSFKGKVIGTAEALVTDDQIIEVANYLEDMGYDVEGSGLVSGDIIRESDVNFSNEEDDEGNRKWTLKEGIDLDDPNHIGTGKIVHVDSLYLKTYLISDNLSYLIKNFNQPFAGILDGIIGEISEAFEYGSYYRTDSIGTLASDKKMSSIGEGLIALYKYDEKGIVAYGSALDSWNNLKSILNPFDGAMGNWGDEIKIDKDSNTLTLKKGLGNSSFTFKLDGWTGRYGMPLEFLLSVHMATMAPDLAYTIATSFDTEVRIALKVLNDREIQGALNIPGVGWKTTDELRNYFQNSWVSGVVGEATNTVDVSKKELGNLLNDFFGNDTTSFDNSTNIDKLSEDFTNYISDAGYDGTTAEGIMQFFHDAFLTLRDTVEDKKFSTYIPFIMEVSDHWYRDVYFTLRDDRFDDIIADGGFVEVDQEYLEETEERWTLYEYKEVTYKDEQTGEEFTETKYVINDDGTKKVDYLSDSSEMQKKDISFDYLTDDFDGWSAYLFDDSQVRSEYEPVDLSGLESSKYEKFKKAAEEGKDYLFASHDFAGAVTQKEDGLRGPTNPKIKDIFNDKYYVYDGTVTTAKAIEKDKVNALTGAITDIQDAMKKTLTNSNSVILRLIEWATPEIKLTTTDDGYFQIKVGNGKPYKIALGVSKWVSDLLPDKYKDESLFKQVEINKDALTAFTILENTETQDADYIYKDFKELLVELDYFDKEELRETIVPVFQWMYKETGSAGWPVKKWEKDPVEYGTLIHSKVNLDFLKEKQYEEDEASGNTGSSGSGSSKPEKVKEPTQKMSNVLSPEEFLDVADEVHKIMEDNNFSYCILGPEKEKHSGECGLDHPVAATLQPGGHKLSCCATYVSWVLQEAEMNTESNFTTNGAKALYDFYSDYFEPVTSYDDLEAGDLIFQTQGTTGCEGDVDQIGHVQICADTDQWYNAGSTSAMRRDSPYTDASYARSTFVVGLSPNGRKKITPFEGFEKDDLVLSPVTGRIIRIGTIGTTDLIYHTAKDERELDIVKIENENPENEYVENLNYIEIEVLDLEEPETVLAGKDEDTKAGYKLFLEDYIAQNCNGYIIRLEGYLHELDLGSLESAESEFIPPEASEYLRNKEEKEKEIEYLENALPGFSAGGEYYIKEGTVLGKTTDCNMKISMFSLEESISENIEDYIEIDEEELFPRQPYQAQEGDLELLANVMHHENCSIALESAYSMSPDEAEMGNKGTGYVIINRALVNYGNYGTTIRDQIGAPGQYATAYLLEETQVHCATCLEAAEWCLTWDCMSLQNQHGEEMARNVLSQSGWCFCPDGTDPGEACWLYLDTVDKGTVNEHTKANPSVFDEFYCKNKAYEGYE